MFSQRRQQFLMQWRKHVSPFQATIKWFPFTQVKDLFQTNKIHETPPNLVGQHLALITIITQYYNLCLQALRNYVEKLISALLSKLSVSGLAAAYQWLILSHSGLSVYCRVLLYKRVSKIHTKNVCDQIYKTLCMYTCTQFYKSWATWKYTHQDQPHVG